MCFTRSQMLISFPLFSSRFQYPPLPTPCSSLPLLRGHFDSESEVFFFAQRPIFLSWRPRVLGLGFLFHLSPRPPPLIVVSSHYTFPLSIYVDPCLCTPCSLRCFSVFGLLPILHSSCWLDSSIHRRPFLFILPPYLSGDLISFSGTFPPHCTFFFFPCRLWSPMSTTLTRFFFTDPLSLRLVLQLR